MNNKGMFLGALGQKLTDSLKEKIKAAVKEAIEIDNIKAFYFYNECEDEDGDKALVLEALKEKRAVSEYIAETMKEYKRRHKETSIKTCIIIGRPMDTNYSAGLYDEIIQGYYIYANDLDCPESLDAYTLRDRYLFENIDSIYWYSDAILDKTNVICFASNMKRIRYL